MYSERREIKPKFHVSEQGSGRCGHHSQYIETIPNAGNLKGIGYTDAKQFYYDLTSINKLV